MPGFVAVYDACVLYPAPLRDLLMRLALTGLYRARWTERIHEEWIGALLRQRPDLLPGDLASTRQQMDAAVPASGKSPPVRNRKSAPTCR